MKKVEFIAKKEQFAKCLVSGDIKIEWKKRVVEVNEETFESTKTWSNPVLVFPTMGVKFDLPTKYNKRPVKSAENRKKLEEIFVSMDEYNLAGETVKPKHDIWTSICNKVENGKSDDVDNYDYIEDLISQWDKIRA